MQLIGLGRLGRDAEVRYTVDGTAVANLALAFDYGRKGEDGKRSTQWVDATLWGERVEKLVDYLKKGQQVYVVCSDAHIEEFERRDGGKGSALRARIDTLEFGARPAGSEGQKPAERQEQKPARQPAAKPATDDFEDDIPF